MIIDSNIIKPFHSGRAARSSGQELRRPFHRPILGGVSWGGHGDWVQIKERFPEEANLGGQEANSGGQELRRPFRRPILGGGDLLGRPWGFDYIKGNKRFSASATENFNFRKMAGAI